MSLGKEDKCDCEENLERQTNEVLALTSIYDGQFTVLPRSEKGYRVKFEVDLPGPHRIKEPHEETSRMLKYLPPLKLHISMPDTYPSHSCPDVSFHTPWLLHSQVMDIKEKLAALWNENECSEILFIWTEFLRNDLIDFLKLPSTIVLSGQQYNDVVSYDEVRRNYEFDYCTVITCEICFEAKSGIQCTMFKPCEHVFCNDCIRTDFEIKIREGNLAGLLCPCQPCQSNADLEQLKSIVSSESFRRYDLLLLQSSLDKMSDVHFCPAKNCSYPVIVDRGDGIGMCPNCQYAFCIYCRKTWHGVEVCSDKSEAIKKLVTEYEAAGRGEKEVLEKRHGKKIFQKVFDELSTNWKKTNGKPCPSCRSYIEKVGGCHKMHCYKCNNYFCWLCLTVLSGDKPYTHFSDDGSSCYNKLFLGVEIDQDAPYLEDYGDDQDAPYLEDYGDDQDEYYDDPGPGEQVVNPEDQNALHDFIYEQPVETLLDLADEDEYLNETYFLGINDEGDVVERVEGYDEEWEENLRLSVVNMQQQLLDVAGNYRSERPEQEDDGQQWLAGEVYSSDQKAEDM